MLGTKCLDDNVMNVSVCGAAREVEHCQSSVLCDSHGQW